MSGQRNSTVHALIVCACAVVGSTTVHCADIADKKRVTGGHCAQAVECQSELGDPLSESAIDVDTMNQLGIRYVRGRGVARNYASAVKWFRRSAGNGYTPAMANLGAMYQEGKGLHRSYGKAYVWLRVALALGLPLEDHDAAVFRLGVIAAHLSPRDIARATRLAGNMAERLAKQGLGLAAGPTDTWTGRAGALTAGPLRSSDTFRHKHELRR